MDARINQPQSINIEIQEKEAEGIYANMAAIGHNNSEFILDFIRIMPGSPKGKVYARIIMTPQNAKSLDLSLSENIKQYEDQYGEIKIDKKETRIGFQKE
ncbi:MAG: DUF3467 domain-containing protein [Candidatus Delongbacteria bacterium]|nr:DUF3467 domain-containing protein [Candidatus Delongbacteria bacterium]